MPDRKQFIGRWISWANEARIEQELFDNGVNIPPSRAAVLIADIAAGRFDPLAGRLLRGVDDRGLLEQQMEDIVARDARALRFSGLEQAKL